MYVVYFQLGHEAKECTGMAKEKCGEFDELEAPIGSEQEFIFLRLNILREYLYNELTMTGMIAFYFHRLMEHPIQFPNQVLWYPRHSKLVFVNLTGLSVMIQRNNPIAFHDTLSVTLPADEDESLPHLRQFVISFFAIWHLPLPDN